MKIEEIASLIAAMEEGTRLRVRVDANPYGVSLANKSDAFDFFARMQADFPEGLSLIKKAEIVPSNGDVSYMKMLCPFKL